MRDEQTAAPLTVFELSRVGAQAELDDCLLVADRSIPTGAGLRISTRSDGNEMSFWVSESEWCDWLSPKLAVPSFDLIAAELIPVLASWTLTPLDHWLQSQGMDPLSSATAEPSPAPTAGWRIKLISGCRRLSLYLDQIPKGWLTLFLTALQPSPQEEHILVLGLGWCLLNENDWPKVAVGDALPIIGMADEPDRMWLHPSASPGQLSLHETNRAIVVPSSNPIADTPEGTLCLTVEAGHTRISASALAGWKAEAELPHEARSHSALRLTTAHRLWAQGELLRIGDGWAFRILARRQ